MKDFPKAEAREAAEECIRQMGLGHHWSPMMDEQGKDCFEVGYRAAWEKVQGEIAEMRDLVAFASGDGWNELPILRDKLKIATEALQRFCYCEKLHPDTGGICEACQELAKIRGDR